MRFSPPRWSAQRRQSTSLDTRLNFVSAFSNQFIIVRNDGTDAITGTFNGLPEGATFYAGGELFSISYVGGTGNDVVLTRLVTPPKPVLTIERVPPASVRLLWTTNDPAYSLQYETDLTATNWAAATPAPVVAGTNYVVTNAAVGVSKFYRLMR